MPKKWIDRVTNAPIIAEGIVSHIHGDGERIIFTIQDPDGVKRSWVINANDPGAAMFITVRDVSFLPRDQG